MSTEPTLLAADALVGTELDGRYRIEAVLGEGGVGRVYRARHLTLDRPVALKVLLEEHRERDSVRARFVREARTLAALQHPNIVTITDFGGAEQLPYLVMELVDGEELEATLQREGLLAPDRALAIFRQILAGLSYAHAQGLVHRDLKPANVLLRKLPDGREHAELLDFGLAKFVTEEAKGPKLTQAGMIVGTPTYMAPEQIEAGAVDARTDIYSSGVILFELLTGRLPFPYPDVSSLLRAHLIEPAPSLREIRPEIPEPVEAVVLKALSKSPDDRFPNASTMLTSLEESLVARPSQATAFPSMDQVMARIAPATEKLMETVGPATDKAVEALSTSVRTVRHLPRKTLIGAGAGFFFVIALFVALALVGGQEESAAAAAEEDVAETVDVESLPTFVPIINERPEARDPWSEPVPERLADIKARLDRGRRVSRRALTLLHNFARDNPDDARPKILHARAYVVRGRLTQAMPHYLAAFQRDPSARGDPRMRRDLVRMARTQNLHEEASQAVVKIYGAEAIPDVDALIEESRRDDDKARLRVLREHLLD